jgi:KRAB domain-containing zinc finger protein
VHIREVHVQERKHICLRCNRGFFKKAYLKKHSCGSTRKSDDDQTLKKLEFDSEKERSDSTQLVLVPDQKLSDPAPITKLSTPKSRIQTSESRMQTSESRMQTQEYLKEKHENPDKNLTSSLHSRENHRYEINFLCFKCKRGFLKICHLEKHFKTCRLEAKMSVKTLTKKQSQNASDTTLKLRSKNQLKIKLKKMEKDQTAVYECPNCNKAFVSKRKLNRHKKEVHIGDIKYGCSSCDKKFARMEHLKRHLKSNNLMCLSPSEEVINYSGVRFMR